MRLLVPLARAWRTGYGWLSVGMAVRAGLQAALVVLLARALGPKEYGLVVAIMSVAGVFAIFSGIGATALHLRDLSVGTIDSSASFRIALKRNLLTFPLLLAAAIVTVTLLYRDHLEFAASTRLVAAEILGFAASDLMQRTVQGRGQYRAMAIYMCLMPALRVAALAVLLFYYSVIDINTWTFIALASAAPPALAVFWQSKGRVGHRQAGGGNDWLEGLGFAIAAGSTRVHADADKAIVARWSSLGAAAEYSLAYRMFDVILLPILSYIEWRTPALFLSGHQRQTGGSLKDNRTFVLVLCVGSVVVSLLSFPLVLTLPLLVGRGYDGVIVMGHCLAALPITSAVWWVYRALLSTSGNQTACGAIELGGAIFNVVTTILLVKWLGWQGAVLGTYATHLAMACGGFTFMRYRRGTS